jgi:CheY-like chemotaxis protein
VETILIVDDEPEGRAVLDDHSPFGKRSTPLARRPKGDDKSRPDVS